MLWPSIEIYKKNGNILSMYISSIISHDIYIYIQLNITLINKPLLKIIVSKEIIKAKQ